MPPFYGGIDSAENPLRNDICLCDAHGICAQNWDSVYDGSPMDSQSCHRKNYQRPLEAVYMDYQEQ
ncbi:hypothetical protein DPMN_166854 [Dreissena polymorpha]|uniref:Uncharacterized protein n=1 Tax=Dreissena polymorpha TaxID=45954 RepID=A0A9D4IUI7_DREPO|nr:hypothetical protein DPMN_166854 [Dreissena polymorpha]